MRQSRGRADPFGLLVLAVMLALVVTIGIQAQASVVDESGLWPRLTSPQLHTLPVDTIIAPLVSESP